MAPSDEIFAAFWRNQRRREMRRFVWLEFRRIRHDLIVLDCWRRFHGRELWRDAFKAAMRNAERKAAA